MAVTHSDQRNGRISWATPSNPFRTLKGHIANDIEQSRRLRCAAWIAEGKPNAKGGGGLTERQLLL
jgi:hypothetical protein